VYSVTETVDIASRL